MSIINVPEIAIKNYLAKWPHKVDAFLYAVRTGVWHIQIDMGTRGVEWDGTSYWGEGKICLYFGYAAQSKKKKGPMLTVNINFGSNYNSFLTFGHITKDTFYGTVYDYNVYKKIINKEVASVFRYTPRLSKLKSK